MNKNIAETEIAGITSIAISHDVKTDLPALATQIGIA